MDDFRPVSKSSERCIMEYLHEAANCLNLFNAFRLHDIYPITTTHSKQNNNISIPIITGNIYAFYTVTSRTDM